MMKKITNIIFVLGVLSAILFSACNSNAPKDNRVTVTFDVKGGKSVGSQRVVPGEYAISPATSRGGFKFIGWFTESECTNEFDFSTPVTTNMTLYAKWEKRIISIDGSASNNKSPINASAFNECDFPGKLNFKVSGSNNTQAITVYREKDDSKPEVLYKSGTYSYSYEATVTINDTMKGYSLTASQYNCSAVGITNITYEPLDD